MNALLPTRTQTNVNSSIDVAINHSAAMRTAGRLGTGFAFQQAAPTTRLRSVRFVGNMYSSTSNHSLVTQQLLKLVVAPGAHHSRRLAVNQAQVSLLVYHPRALEQRQVDVRVVLDEELGCLVVKIDNLILEASTKSWKELVLDAIAPTRRRC